MPATPSLQRQRAAAMMAATTAFMTMCTLTILCLVIGPSSSLFANGTVVKFGSTMPIIPYSWRIPIITQTWSNVLTGIQSAFKEANDFGALPPGDSVQMVVKDINDTFGLGLVENQQLLFVDQVTGLLFTSYYGVHTGVALTRPNSIPMIGSFSPETELLFGPQARNAVNWRGSFQSEIRHAFNYMLNSHMHITAITVMYYNVASVIALKDALLEILKELGVEKRFAIPMEKVQNDRVKEIDMIMKSGSQAAIFLSAADLVIPHILEALNHPDYNPDEFFWFGASAANIPQYPPMAAFKNLYIVQQMPDPYDATFLAVKNYHDARQRLLTQPGGWSPFGAVVDTRFNYEQLEGYVLGRLTVEVLKRCAGNYTPQHFLDIVYSTKTFVVGDLIAGPFADGCLGRSSDLAFPCFCNTGSKFMYLGKVNPSTGLISGVVDDASLGEKGVATSQIPLSQCELQDSDISRPLLFAQMQDSGLMSSTTISAESYRVKSFAQALRWSVNAIRPEMGVKKVALVQRRFASINATQDVTRVARRFEPLAFLGSTPFDPKITDWSPNGSVAQIGSYDGHMPVTDAEASLPWNPTRFTLDAVVADYVHTLASLYARVVETAISSDTAPKVPHIYATSAQLGSLATKSFNTYQHDPTVEVGAATAAAANDWMTKRMLRSHTDRLQNWAMIVTDSVAVVEAALRFATVNPTSVPPMTLLVAASEEVIQDAVNRDFTGGLLAALRSNGTTSSSQAHIYFASLLRPFWDGTSQGTGSLVGKYNRLYQNGNLSSTQLLPNVIDIKTFRLVQFAKDVADPLRVPTSDSFIESIYLQQSISSLDMTFGPFSDRRCTSATEAASPERNCQCSKGPRRFFVHRLSDWAGRASVGDAFTYDFSMTTCGVKYSPLATSLLDVATVAGATAAGVVFLAALVMIGVLFATRGSAGRDSRMAPKDASKPFTVAFTDIQSSTNLWARVPQQMAQAVETHHELIRKLIQKHKGYEVKTIGDAFMIAFVEPKDAVLLALDLQTTFYAHNWETKEIDTTYVDLATEKAQDEGKAPPWYKESEWNGLRVRVGVHTGEGTIKLDPVAQSYDYYGTVVNTAARVEGVGHGGQVLITQATHAALFGGGNNNSLPNVDVVPLGAQHLRGLEESVVLYQMLPHSLGNRQFPALRLDVETVVDEEADLGGSPLDGGLATEVSSRTSHVSRQAAAGFIIPMAEKYARRTTAQSKIKFNKAMESIISNYAFLKAILSTTPEKQQKQVVEAMLSRWHVKPTRPPMSKPSQREVVDHSMMQLALRASPAASAVTRDLNGLVSQSVAAYANAANTTSDTDSERIPSPPDRSITAPTTNALKSPKAVERHSPAEAPPAAVRSASPRPEDQEDEPVESQQASTVQLPNQTNDE